MDTHTIGGQEYSDFESFGRRCGCPRPSYVKIRQIDAKMRDFRPARCASSLFIPLNQYANRFVAGHLGACPRRRLRHPGVN